MPRSLPLIVEFVTSEIEEHSFTSCLIASAECGIELNVGCAGGGTVETALIGVTEAEIVAALELELELELELAALVEVETALGTMGACSARGESIAWFPEDGGHRMGAKAARRGD